MVQVGRATDDSPLIEKAIALSEGWFETLPPDGNARMRAYAWDKLVCGLVDLAKVQRAAKRAVGRSEDCRMGVRTFDRTPTTRRRPRFLGRWPGRYGQIGQTLSENLYRAYLSPATALQGIRRHLALRGYRRAFAQT